MGIEQRIRDAERLVVFTHVGAVPDDELSASYRALLGAPDHPHDYDRLVDLRLAESAVRSVAAVRSMGSLVRRTGRSATNEPRTAIVAPHDVSFGLARVYAAYLGDDPGPVRVFRTVEEALAWLGVGPEVLSD